MKAVRRPDGYLITISPKPLVLVDRKKRTGCGGDDDSDDGDGDDNDGESRDKAYAVTAAPCKQQVKK